MAAQIQSLTRRFKHGDVILSDPDFGMSPDAVLDFYAAQYPELATASFETVEEDLDNGQLTYVVKKKYDTKG